MAELVEAAKAGNLAGLRDYVIRHGYDVNFRCPPDGSTALYWGACSGHLLVCDWLVSHGADVGLATTKSGSTALHGAADRGHYECVDLLLKRGSHVDQQTTTNGDTALHLAAYRGHSAVCRLLIEHDANISLVNKQGRTALDEAKIKDHEDVCKLLYRHSSYLQKQGFRYGKAFYSKPEFQDTFVEIGDDRVLDLHRSDAARLCVNAYRNPATTDLESSRSSSSAACPSKEVHKSTGDPFHHPFDSHDDRRLLPANSDDDQLKRLQSKVTDLESHVEGLELKLSVCDRSLEQLSAENASLRAQLDAMKSSAATHQELMNMRRQKELYAERAEKAIRELEETRRRYKHLESVVYGVSRELKGLGQRDEAT